jgi:plastocyanin
MKTLVLSGLLNLLTACSVVLISQSLHAANIVVGLYDCGMDLPNISVNVGDSVTWVKENAADPGSYQVVSYTGEWKSPLITTGSFSYTFSKPGTVYYHSSADTRAVGTVTVLPWTNSPPAVSIITPPDGFYFVGGSWVLLQASTTNSASNVIQVAYYAGTNLLGIATNAPYRVMTSAFALGTNTLTAQMTDVQGMTWTSPPVTVTLTYVLYQVGYLWAPHRLPGGRFAFNFSTTAVRPSIECSEDLVNWICGSGTLCSDYGAYVDEYDTNRVKLFYRVISFP